MGFDKVVEPGEISVCDDEALPESFCRQTFFQVQFTLFSTVLADIQGTFSYALESLRCARAICAYVS